MMSNDITAYSSPPADIMDFNHEDFAGISSLQGLSGLQNVTSLQNVSNIQNIAGLGGLQTIAGAGMSALQSSSIAELCLARQPYLDHSYAVIFPSSRPVCSPSLAEQVGDFTGLASLPSAAAAGSNTLGIGGRSKRKAAQFKADPWEGSVTRCICNFTHDDGFMICCDICGVWQHVDCMGVDKSNIPENYLCELCKPRPIDIRRAIRMQIQKRERELRSDASDEGLEEVMTTMKKTPKLPRKRQNSHSASGEFVGTGTGSTGVSLYGRKTSKLSLNDYEKSNGMKVGRSNSVDDKFNGDDVDIPRKQEKVKARKRSDSKSDRINTLKIDHGDDNLNLFSAALEYGRDNKLNGGTRSERRAAQRSNDARATKDVDSKLEHRESFDFFSHLDFKYSGMSGIQGDLDRMQDLMFSDIGGPSSASKDKQFLRGKPCKRKRSLSKGEGQSRRGNTDKIDSPHTVSSAVPVTGSADASSNHKSQVQPSKRGVRRKPSSVETSSTTTGNVSNMPAASRLPPDGGIVHELTGGIHVRETEKNAYSGEVSTWLVSKKRPAVTGSSRHRSTESTELDLTTINDQLSNHRFIVRDISLDTKIVEATGTIGAGQVIGEYTGSVMLRNEYEHNKQFDMSFPFVLCYTGLNQPELCVDATLSHNEMRFVRCSCSPNAKIVHLIVDNGIRFFICATKNITIGMEVAIPFNYDYRKCSIEVKCACSKLSCPVAKFYKTKQFSESNPSAIGKRKASVSEDKSENIITDGPAKKVETVNKRKQHHEEKAESKTAAHAQTEDKTDAGETIVATRRPRRHVPEKVQSSTDTSSYDNEQSVVSPKKLRVRHVAVAPPQPVAKPAAVRLTGRPARSDVDTKTNTRGGMNIRSPSSSGMDTKSDSSDRHRLLSSNSIATPASVIDGNEEKKSREQRKIEAIERTFERIEQRSRQKGTRHSTEAKQEEDVKPIAKNLRGSKDRPVAPEPSIKSGPVTRKPPAVTATAKSAAVGSRRNYVTSRTKR